MLAFKFMVSFSSMFTVYIYVYVYTFIIVNKMLSPYNVNRICVFSADHFVLNNQLVCSFLGDIISPAPSIPQLL